MLGESAGFHELVKFYAKVPESRVQSTEFISFESIALPCI